MSPSAQSSSRPSSGVGIRSSMRRVVNNYVITRKKWYRMMFWFGFSSGVGIMLFTIGIIFIVRYFNDVNENERMSTVNNILWFVGCLTALAFSLILTLFSIFLARLLIAIKRRQKSPNQPSLITVFHAGQSSLSDRTPMRSSCPGELRNTDSIPIRFNIPLQDLLLGPPAYSEFDQFPSPQDSEYPTFVLDNPPPYEEAIHIETPENDMTLVNEPSGSSQPINNNNLEISVISSSSLCPMPTSPPDYFSLISKI